MRLPELRSWFVAVLTQDHGCLATNKRGCEKCQSQADALTAAWRDRFHVEPG